MIKQRIILAVILAMFVAAIGTLVILKVSDYTPPEDRMNAVCQPYGGIQQIPSDTKLVVCRDGRARSY